MRIVHLWVGAIDALEHAPGGVAVQRAGGVVQGGARLWQGKEVQAALAVQEGISARQQGAPTTSHVKKGAGMIATEFLAAASPNRAAC